MEIDILYEDSHIFVVEKPPGMPCQKDKTEDLDLLTILARKLKKDYNVRKPYIGLIHRLDRPVGGAILYAKTKPAAANLTKQIQERKINKEYLAVVCGKPEEEEATLRNYLIKNAAKNMSRVVDENYQGSKEAILDYKVIQTVETEEFGDITLLKVILKTGRHHQIRVQLSHHNLPLWGDTKYNKSFTRRKEWSQIALWAYKVSFEHPKTNKQLSFESMPCSDYPWKLFNLSTLD